VIRELAQRNASGEIVTLRWCDATDKLSVTVHRDHEFGVEFVTAECENIAPELALDAFQHPYAYAWHSGSVTLPARTSIYTDDSEDEGDEPEFSPSGGSSVVERIDRYFGFDTQTNERD
jgi:hypothetical protein